MKIEVWREDVDVWVITDAPGLDPIHLFWQDLGESKGRLIVECYGRAWSAFWGSMGGKSLYEFVKGIDAGYLSGCLAPQGMKASIKDQAYILRISKSVIEAVRSGESS